MDERQQTISISASTTGEQAAAETPAEQSAAIEHNTQDFLNDLIRRQCELLEALAGIILLRPMRDQDAASIVKHISDQKYDLSSRQLKKLADVATRSARENRPLLESMAASSGLLSHQPDYHVVAAPLRLSGRPQGASVCILPFSPHDERREELQSLELSGAMLEAYLWKQQAYNEAQSKIQLRETLDLVDKSFQGHTAQEMASIFSNEIQRRFGCTRVAIGLVKGHAIRVVGVSGSEDVDRKSELVEVLEAVMEECADQDVEIRFPQPDGADASERRVVRAHASLSEKYGPAAIASFPLRVDDGLIGVVVMERSASDPFNDASLHLLRLVAEYVGPTIWTRRLADRGVLAVSRDRTIELAQAAVGPQKTGAKTLALIALLLLIVSIVVPVRDRVIGDGRVVAEVRRQISAPFEGRIAEVFVKPGDSVSIGDPLVRLDTVRSEYQLTQKQNELMSLYTQADEAREKGKIPDAKMLDSKIEMTRQDINLLQYRIDEALIKSPIAGVVTQGRLEDIRGEVISPADPLLEIADLSSISSMVLVPEQGISRVRVGQTGRLALTARPGEKIEFEVVHLTPASEVFQQRNVYRVEVELKNPPEWLRPGMEGQAKIQGDTSNLLTIYTRPIVDAIRMRFWW